jgi:DNA (cytosine-5)-methyltransferase 1
MSMLAVDLFAGLGGFSEGARMAGVPVVWAANHWRAAVDVHQANHPEVVHACQDLHQANWHEVPAHDLLLASPACQGHSRARGVDRPHHDACRSTAWAVVSCAEVHRPAVVVVENVPEFLKWALYPAWVLAMEALGYALAPHVLDAADSGVPQHRQRVFVVGTRSRAAMRLSLPRRSQIGAHAVISWDHPAGRKVTELASRTQERVAAGRSVHGDRFLVAYYGNERGGRCLRRPLGTVTTRDRYGLVQGDRLRMLTVQEYRRAMGFPPWYKLPATHKESVHMLGNAVCPPQAADVINAIKEAA